MSSDLQALLAAIVADPGDDTARLAYADCLQEHGNDARASFIRLQIEAERLHPHSNARGALEAQAQALFERHWVEWWGELCAAVGLKPPLPAPSGRFAKFAQWAGVRTAPGNPYCATRLFRPTAAPGAALSVTPATFDLAARNYGFRAAVFRRGFPDALTVGDRPGEDHRERHALVRAWTAVAPLDALCGKETDLGEPGAHLTGLRSLSLLTVMPHVLETWLASPHLARLEALDFPVSESGEAFRDWPRLFATPVAQQLKRLGPLEWLPEWGAALRHADPRELRSLSIRAHRVPIESLSGIPSSSFGERLEELTLDGPFMNSLFRQFGCGAWPALRKLVIRGGTHAREMTAITQWRLAALDEFELPMFKLNSGALAALRQAPTLKNVRHCSLCCWTRDPKLIAGLADVVDPNRIETFALALSGTGSTAEARAVLERKFGDRVRFLT